MNRLFIQSLALLGASLASSVFAAAEATVLFAQPGTVIIDAQGISRPVKRGDVVQSGERLSTPPGGISQLKLLDGSLLGVRPDSEVKITPPPPQAADKGLQVVSLTKGAVRVLGAELMDAKNPSRFTLQSGSANLQLKGADLESSITPPTTGPKPPGGSDPGSYNRMLVGTGTIGNGTTFTPLEPRQVSFVGTINTMPTRVASLPLSPTPIVTRPVATLATPNVTTPNIAAPIVTAPIAITPPVISPILVTPIITNPVVPIVFVPPPIVTVKPLVLKCIITRTGQKICS